MMMQSVKLNSFIAKECMTLLKWDLIECMCNMHLLEYCKKCTESKKN